MSQRIVDLSKRELGAFRVLDAAGRDEKKSALWRCEHLRSEGGCGTITIISSRVLLIRAPKYCTNCRPKNYRANNRGW